MASNNTNYRRDLPATPPRLHCNLKIWGPPGTGKTFQGAKFLSKYTSDAAQVVAVTYRRVLAKELKTELQKHGVESAETGSSWPWVSTIHGVARRALGYDMKNCAAAVKPRGVDDEETRERMRTDFFEKFFEETETPYQGTGPLTHGQLRGDLLLAARSWKIHTLEQEDLTRFPSWGKLRDVQVSRFDVQEFREDWRSFKKKHKVWDWDDLLLDALEREAVPEAEFLFVDEAQDNSPLMHCLVAMWAEKMDAAAVAGDPNQAIYSFIGADPSLFWEYVEGERERTLDQCRRFPSTAWGPARETLSFSGHPVPELDFSDNQAPGAVNLYRFRDVEKKVGNSLETFHLVRTRRQISGVAEMLERAGVPYETQLGNGWSDRQRNLLNAFIKAPALAEWSRGKKLTEWGESGSSSERNGKPPEALSRKEFKEFVKVCPAEHVSGAKKELLESPPVNGVPVDRWPEFFKPSVAEFLANPVEDAVRMERGTEKKIAPALQRFDSPVKSIKNKICTIHAAKGRERPVVFLYDGVTKNIKKEAQPFHREPEEARVWFVGLSRHKEVLNIVETPRGSYLKPSPFLHSALREVSCL